MTKIIFKHWKTGKHIIEVGYLVHNHPASDRLVLKKTDGTFVDIIKDRIILQEEV